MSDLTWPIVVSIVGLLVPLLASYFQRTTEKTSLRQLERVAAVEAQRARLYVTEDGKLVPAAQEDDVLKELRELQAKLVKELEQQMQRSEDRRALSQALGYLLFVIVGVAASGFALAQAVISGSNDFKVLAIVATSILLALNVVGFTIALFFVVDTLGVLFPRRGPELSSAKTLAWVRKKLGRASTGTDRQEEQGDGTDLAPGDADIQQTQTQ